MQPAARNAIWTRGISRRLHLRRFSFAPENDAANSLAIIPLPLFVARRSKLGPLDPAGFSLRRSSAAVEAAVHVDHGPRHVRSLGGQERDDFRDLLGLSHPAERNLLEDRFLDL